MDSSKELIIITGVSGAGKSSAMAFMEDAGYYCIDNMPPELMSCLLYTSVYRLLSLHCLF